MLEQQPENPSLSHPMVVDLIADSSSEGSSGPNHLQVVRGLLQLRNGLNCITIHRRLRPLIRPPPLLSRLSQIVQPFRHLPHLLPRLLVLAQLTLGSNFYPRMVCLRRVLSNPHKTRSQNRTLRYLFLLSQCWMNQRRSGPLYAVRNLPNSSVIPYVKLTEEAQMSQPHIRGPSQDLPSGSAPPFSSSPQKPLIHGRLHIDILEVSSISFAEVDKTLITID